MPAEPDNFTIEYTTPAVLPGDGHDTMPATTPVEPSSPIAGMPQATQRVSPPSGNTLTSADRNTPTQRYLRVQNIEAELDEELLLATGEEPTSFAEAEPHAA